MNTSVRALVGIAAAAMLSGCAGQTEQLTMQTAPPHRGRAASGEA